MNMNFPKTLSLLSLSIALAGCGKEKSPDKQLISVDKTGLKPATEPQELAGSKPAAVSANVAAVSANVAAVTVRNGVVGESNLNAAMSGPNLMLLDADALEEVFRPVFGNQPRKDEPNIVPGGTVFFTSLPNEFFNPDEKEMLGAYRISSSSSHKSFMGERPTLNQDYLFALRRFGAGACKRLVEAEMANAQATTNKLVVKSEMDSGTASPETVSKFMTLLFGYAPASGLHSGAVEYSSIMQKSVNQAAAADRTKAIKENYRLICAYVVSDPRTYSR